MRLRDILGRELKVGDLTIVPDPLNKSVLHLGIISNVWFDRKVGDSKSEAVLNWWMDLPKANYRKLSINNDTSFYLVDLNTLPSELINRYNELIENNWYSIKTRIDRNATNE